MSATLYKCRVPAGVTLHSRGLIRAFFILRYIQESHYMRAQRDADQIWSFNVHICDMGPFLVFLVKFLSGLIIEPNERNEGSDHCADAQSDQGFRCPQTESLDTTEYFNGEKMPGLYFVHVQDDVSLHILQMFDGTFSLDAALPIPIF